MRFLLSSVLACFWFTGCATYSSLPLAQQANLASTTANLTIPAREFETPGVRVTRVDLRRPLDATDVAALAVLNDPTLAATRAEDGVAAAQSYAAGLLPWPQITLGTGRPDPPGTGLSNPWSLSLDQNAAALLQHGAVERGARASEQRVRLDVIWDEWQVAQQARLLYADVEAADAEYQCLQPLTGLLAAHLKAAQAGVAGDRLSRAAAIQAQAAYGSVTVQLGTLQVRRDRDLAALRGLLGLAPDAALRLAGDDHPTLPEARNLQSAITALPRRRPDLMAMAAAYASADERLQQAILAQFPLIGVSIHRERDTEGVISNGVSLTLTLPFLNAARGEVAVARATRQSLHDDYQARLDTAVTEVTSLNDEAVQLQLQFEELQRAIGERPPAAQAEVGAVRFDTLAAYVTQRGQIGTEIAETRLALDQAAIALDTLLGMPLDEHAKPQATDP